MPRYVTTIQVDAEIHNRLVEVRSRLSSEQRGNENSIGLAPMLSLLLDHWQQNQPPELWLNERVQLYPKRGRPPRQLPGTAIRTSGERWRDQVQTKDHELIAPAKLTGTAHPVYHCKHCNMVWSTWDFKRPPAVCPRDGKFSSLYQPKAWTKIELLALGFTDDEVAWCAQ